MIFIDNGNNRIRNGLENNTENRAETKTEIKFENKAENMNANIAENPADKKLENVSQWNEEFSRTNEMIKETVPQIRDLYDRLQEALPEVGKIYGEVLNFSDNFNKEYVRKMADNLIDIYSNILKMYNYHKPLAAESTDANFKDAVENYVDFMDMIEDSLSLFGVTTVKSSIGTSFDGSIHEAKNPDFNPASGKVQENITPGFMYNGRVIRKESVIIK